MTKPLVLLLYEKMLPGGQLVNRLEDMDYRVHSLGDPSVLVQQAERDKPLLVIADLEPQVQATCQAIDELRRHPPTSHIPVIALVSGHNADAETAARNAAANLVVNEQVILQHLRQFLDQALSVE